MYIIKSVNNLKYNNDYIKITIIIMIIMAMLGVHTTIWYCYYLLHFNRQPLSRAGHNIIIVHTFLYETREYNIQRQWTYDGGGWLVRGNIFSHSLILELYYISADLLEINVGILFGSGY